MAEIELDAASEAFCRDVEVIAEKYRADGVPIQTRLIEQLDKARAIEKAAREEYRKASLAHNDLYAKRIQHAATIRKKKCEHPEWIDAAVVTVLTLMGGSGSQSISGMTEDEARNARRTITSKKKKLLDQEAEKKRYADISVKLL